LPQFLILHQFNRHVTKRLVRKIPGDVSKVPRRKPRVAVGESDVHGRLALDFVGDVSIAERDVEIVVAMAVHERRSMVALEGMSWRKRTAEGGRPYEDLGGVHNLPADNSRDHSSRQLPSIKGRVPRLRE